MNYPIQLLKIEKVRLIKRLAEAHQIDYKKAIEELDKMQNELDIAISILEKAGNVN